MLFSKRALLALISYLTLYIVNVSNLPLKMGGGGGAALTLSGWVQVGTRGGGRNFSRGGGSLNAIFQKGSFCNDLLPNTLYRKCIKFASQKGGGGPTDPSDPPFRRPWVPTAKLQPPPPF